MNNKKIIDLPEVKLLSGEETRQYIKEAQNGSREALDKLVEHNLRLVLKMTYRFKNSQYDLQDLFQVGVVGLIKAIKGFDLTRNVKFSTYAVAKILGEIKLHLREEGMIKVSRSLKKISRIIKKRQEELSKKLHRKPTIGELAAETEYSREEIVQALEASKNPASLYKTIYQQEGKELKLLDSLKNEESEEDINSMARIALFELIKELDKRSRMIIYLRYFRDKTQQEVGEEIGVSQVQVSRLERKILRRLKEKLKTR